jgi:hypothetical protein
MLNFNLSLNTQEVIIHIYSEAATEKQGRIALARIVLGDGSFLSMIYQKFGDQLRWRPPYMQLTQNGHTDSFPTMGGSLMDQAAAIAQRAQRKLKAAYSPIPYGTTFRVTRDKVEIIPNPKEEPLAA